MPASLLSAALCLVLFAACGEAGGSGPVLAKVGESEVHASDLQPLLQGLGEEQRQALAQDPAALNQIVRTLILRRLLFKQAEAAEFGRDPEFQAQLEQLRQAALAEGFLLSQAAPPPAFPSEAELRETYESNKAALLVPRQFRLAQIYIAVPPGSDAAVAEAAKARLDSLERALREPGADFASLAQNESDEPASAAKGGEIGWVAESLLQPGVREGIAGLQPGQISRPILLDDGWHIIRVLELREAYTPSLEEVREPLARRMRAEVTRANSEAYVANLLQENPIAINEIEVSKLLKDIGGPPTP